LDGGRPPEEGEREKREKKREKERERQGGSRLATDDSCCLQEKSPPFFEIENVQTMDTAETQRKRESAERGRLGRRMEEEKGN